MFWIHGGSFYYSAGSDYNGTQLAKQENVVIVTINYRLGTFGFLSRDINGTKGNNGFRD